MGLADDGGVECLDAAEVVVDGGGIDAGAAADFFAGCAIETFSGKDLARGFEQRAAGATVLLALDPRAGRRPAFYQVRGHDSIILSGRCCSKIKFKFEFDLDRRERVPFY